MRKIIRPPTPGKQRIKKGFLLFPKTLKMEDGTLQRRWLETTEWVQEFSHGYDCDHWFSVEWLED